MRDINSRSLQRTTTLPNPPAIESNFGGFPNPLRVVADFASSRIGPLRRAQDNAFPRTSTLVSTRSRTRRPSMESVGAPKYSKPVDYISFDATVGRNSRFHHLTTAQQEELGGVEYRVRPLLTTLPSCFVLNRFSCDRLSRFSSRSSSVIGSEYNLSPFSPLHLGSLTLRNTPTSSQRLIHLSIRRSSLSTKFSPV